MGSLRLGRTAMDSLLREDRSVTGGAGQLAGAPVDQPLGGPVSPTAAARLDGRHQVAFVLDLVLENGEGRSDVHPPVGIATAGGRKAQTGRQLGRQTTPPRA